MAGKNMVRVKDATLIEKTGKDWASWFKLLDKDKAHNLQHNDIARLLYDKHKVPEWWCQMVTVGYEQEKGLRVVGQDCNGVFKTSKSATIAASAKEIYEAWADEKKRARWLNCKLEQRKCTPYKTLRFGVTGGSAMEVRLTPKGPDKTQVVVDHSKLKNKIRVDRMKAYWEKALLALSARLATKPAARAKAATR